MQKLYVLGHPVAHSKSPVMYNAVYRALGLDWEYGFADIESPEDARAFIEARDFLSINITTPHKPVAFSCADVVTSSAALAEGANVLISKQGSLIADNTDGIGCISYLKRRGVEFSGASVVVCGTGPTARAIMHAAALAGAARVSLMGRDDARAKATVADYREELAKLASEVEAEEGEGSDVAPEAKVGAIDGHEANAAPKTEVEAEEGTKAPAKSKRVICSIDPRYAQASLGEIAASCDVVGRSYDQGRDLLKDADVIIDATRLGMKENDPAPFDTSLISSRQTVFDVVYAHGVTNLIAAARAAGAAAYDGEGMLVAQAVATVHDIESALVLSVGFDSIDLFEVMAQSAGFKCAQCV